MNRRLHQLLLTGALALAAGAGAGEPWPFATPPSALRPVTVNADWRGYGAVEIECQFVGPLPAEPVLASFFIETKQDWWFESRQALRLDGTPQRFRLRLDDLSPDWQSPNLRRTFGVDVLRWVRTWGVKVYSGAPAAGTLRLGDLRLVAARPPPVELADICLPAAPLAGELNLVRFRLVNFAADPFDAKAGCGAMCNCASSFLSWPSMLETTLRYWALPSAISSSCCSSERV